eukprot:15446398-Alexandrium_andersonii.AAC.1
MLEGVHPSPTLPQRHPFSIHLPHEKRAQRLAETAKAIAVADTVAAPPRASRNRKREALEE